MMGVLGEFLHLDLSELLSWLFHFWVAIFASFQHSGFVSSRSIWHDQFRKATQQTLHVERSIADYTTRQAPAYLRMSLVCVLTGGTGVAEK